MQNNLYNEKKNKKTALAISIGVHLLLLVLVSTLVTCHKSGSEWPRQSEIGIALNHGDADVGSGDESRQSEESTEEQPEEQVDSDSEAEEEEVTEEDPSGEPLEDQDTDSPVETSDEASDSDASAETSSSSSEQSEAGEDDQSSGEGDDETGEEDKGVDEGIDSSSVYTGEHGGGNDGMSLDIAGWRWKETPDFEPMPRAGEVKVSFIVNDLGRVRSVKIEKSTYTPDELKDIENKIKQIVFEQTSSSGRPSGTTPGTLTIKFKGR